MKVDICPPLLYSHIEVLVFSDAYLCYVNALACSKVHRDLKTDPRGIQRYGRLSSLTNSALVYEPKCGGRGQLRGSQTMSTLVYTGAQIYFGNLTPHVTFDWSCWSQFSKLGRATYR
jgi:hypothetical protein